MVEAFDYLESRADADELIEEFGQSVAIRRTTNSGTPWEPTQTTADYPTKAARVEFTMKQIRTRTVLATDTRWLVAAGPLGNVVPAVDDALVVGGVVVGKLVQVDPLNPAGIAVMFDCHVRV